MYYLLAPASWLDLCQAPGDQGTLYTHHYISRITRDKLLVISRDPRDLREALQTHYYISRNTTDKLLVISMDTRDHLGYYGHIIISLGTLNDKLLVISSCTRDHWGALWTHYYISRNTRDKLLVILCPQSLSQPLPAVQLSQKTVMTATVCWLS